MHQGLLSIFLITAMLLPACAPKRPDCRSEEIFCIGLVTGFGKISDQSFNQSAWEGVQQAEQELGALVEYIETADARDATKNIATFADESFDVVVTVGSSLRIATRAAAEVYPDVRFIGVDQDQFEGALDNLAGLVFPEDKAGFLAGALAAMMSETHKVGAVCASDAIPPIWRLGEGYRAGAAHADELNETSTAVLVVYHNKVSFDTTFIDPEWGDASANAMMKEGVDVLFGCGGETGNGAVIAAARARIYALGVDTDQYLTLPEAAPRILSSAMKLIKPGVFELLKMARQGVFPGGNYLGDVTYAPFHDLGNEVPPEVQAALEQIAAGLGDDSIKTGVPSEKR